MSEFFGGDLGSSSAVVKSTSVSSAVGHKRTLSQGLSKLLSLSQMSNVDNADCSPADTRLQSEGESPLAIASEVSEKQFATSTRPGSGQTRAVIPNPGPQNEGSHPQDPELLRKIIMELKKVMEVQKKDYEDQIKR